MLYSEVYIQKRRNWIDLFSDSSNDVVSSYQDILKNETLYKLHHPDLAGVQSTSKLEKELISNVIKQDVEYRYRNFIKNVYCYFEGSIWSLKELLLCHPETNKLSNKDRMFLEEKKEKISNGKIETVKAKASMAVRIRQTIEISIEFRKLNISIDFNSTQWNYLIHGIEIRKKITHPTCKEDLIVDISDVEEIRQAYTWYNELMTRLVPSM